MLFTTDDMARLHADEAVEAGGDGWRRCPLRVVAFEARVEGILLVIGLRSSGWWWYWLVIIFQASACHLPAL